MSAVPGRWGSFSYNSRLICCTILNDNPTEFCQNEAVKGKLYCKECIDKAEAEKAEQS